MQLFQCLLGFSLFGIVFSQWQIDSSDQADCRTPSGAEGNCVDIQSCQFILDIFTKAPRPLPQSTVQLLQSYGCGFTGNTPKVCCPIPVIQPVTDGFSTITTVKTPPDVTSNRNIGLINAPNCGPIAIDRIFGGNKTAPFDYPWMALIAYNTRTGLSFRCGGTLINQNYVLTAAHCITGLQAPTSLVGVRIGEHNILTEIDCDDRNPDDCAPRVQDFTIAEVIPHPQYDATTLENDIGLLRLSGSANMESEAVRPICLPTGDLRKQVLRGKNAVVAGWGITETGYASPDLLQVSLPVISTEECQARYNQSRVQVTIGVNQLCAGGVNGKDSCSGDSGGPLKVTSNLFNDSRYVQYGIVSFGPKLCGVANQPGVYTNVPYYMDWILDNLKP